MLPKQTWKRRTKPQVSWATTKIAVFHKGACEWNLFWTSNYPFVCLTRTWTTKTSNSLSPYPPWQQSSTSKVPLTRPSTGHSLAHARNFFTCLSASSSSSRCLFRGPRSHLACQRCVNGSLLYLSQEIYNVHQCAIMFWIFLSWPLKPHVSMSQVTKNQTSSKMKKCLCGKLCWSLLKPLCCKSVPNAADDADSWLQ